MSHPKNKLQRRKIGQKKARKRTKHWEEDWKTPELLKRLEDNTKLCSGFCCSNKRKYWGKPISELKQDEKDGEEGQYD